jgi:hypothetical protein
MNITHIIVQLNIKHTDSSIIIMLAKTTYITYVASLTHTQCHNIIG